MAAPPDNTPLPPDTGGRRRERTGQRATGAALNGQAAAGDSAAVTGRSRSPTAEDKGPQRRPRTKDRCAGELVWRGWKRECLVSSLHFFFHDSIAASAINIFCNCMYYFRIGLSIVYAVSKLI